MKQIKWLGLILIAALLLAPSAQAQFLGQLAPARTLSQGSALAGGYFGLYEDALAFFGQFRYGMARNLDGALKFGFIDFDGPANDAGFVIGADLKYQFFDDRLGDPLDLAFGGSFGFAGTSDFTDFALGFDFISSKSFKMRNGNHVTPYGRLNLRGERVEVDTPFGNADDTDFNIGLNLGTDFELTTDFSLLGELQIDDQMGFIAGFAYRF